MEVAKPKTSKDLFADWLSRKAQQAVVPTEMQRYDGDIDAYIEERGSPDQVLWHPDLKVLKYPGAFVAQDLRNGQVLVYDNVYFGDMD